MISETGVTPMIAEYSNLINISSNTNNVTLDSFIISGVLL